MAKKENPDMVPKKFRKLQGSFLDHLQEGNSSFFRSFPKGLTFYGKEKDEHVVLIVRSHWIVFLPYIGTVFLILLVPLIFLLMSESMKMNASFIISLFIMCFTIALSVSVYAFVRWFYNVNIITDKRILDLDVTSIVSHSQTEARLDKIEDLTHKQIGVLGSFFDFGTVYIQTAGAKAEIDFDNIPRPREVQDILHDLFESKLKGEI